MCFSSSLKLSVVATSLKYVSLLVLSVSFTVAGGVESIWSRAQQTATRHSKGADICPFEGEYVYIPHTRHGFVIVVVHTYISTYSTQCIPAFCYIGMLNVSSSWSVYVSGVFGALRLRALLAIHTYVVVVVVKSPFIPLPFLGGGWPWGQTCRRGGWL